MRTLTLALDDDLAALIEREKPLEPKALRESLVMDLFHRRKISLGKACELLGLDRAAFVRRADELGVPVLLTTEKDFEADTATLDAWLKEQS